MTASYLPYTPEQGLLLPPSLDDCLPAGHLAYFIGDTVDALDLSAFHARYAAGGPRNQPFHPVMMVKVLLYGYATGVFSSRKLAKKLHEDVALRVLGAGNFPAHRTLCDFRALHLEELAALFVQGVKLARECGLVKLGTIAMDGTKVKANASRHKAMSYKRMVQAEAELKAQIDALFERARQANAAEEREPALDAIQGTLDALPTQVLADAGYRSEETLKKLADSPCEVFVALGREGREDAAIDADKYPHTAAMAARLRREAGKTAYRRRKAIVEAPNGWIKAVLGFRQFSLRGIEKVRAEWKLVCMALNLRRMAYL